MKGSIVLENMTVFDHRGNFNLVYVDEVTGEAYARKACLNELDMSQYNSLYSQEASGRLLDYLYVYADSPEDYYDLMFHCVSPSGIYSSEYPVDEMWSYRVAKSQFFASLRERGTVSMPNYICVNDFALSDVTAVINPGSLGLLSIPAYMVLSLFNFLTIDREKTVGRGAYQTMAPPQLHNLEKDSVQIHGFEEYLQAFHRGNFLTNDSDLFLTVYGLAHSFAAFSWLIKNTSMREEGKIENLVRWEPFTWTWNTLIESGAMQDPFAEVPMMRSFTRFGALNGEELNADLHAALKLTDLLLPCFASPGAPWEKLSIFYGLVDAFPLRDYFGIAPDKTIKFAK